MEMFCKSVLVLKPLPPDKIERRKTYLPQEYAETERHYLYGHVDVVAWKNGKLWAFEVKNQGDPCKKALVQVKNYCECFDYVCVVADNLKDLTQHRPQFRELGVGTYHWRKKGAHLLDEPRLQSPDQKMRQKLYDRFLRNTGMKKQPSHRNPFKTPLEGLGLRQLSLEQYFKGQK